jgi:hypothetical protein
LSCIAFGHRVLKTTRDAAPFEKNLASKFANEKRTAVYHPCLTDLGCRRGPRIFRCSAIFFAEGLTWSCLRIFPNSKTGKQRPGSIRNARVRILSLQPPSPAFGPASQETREWAGNPGFSRIRYGLWTLAFPNLRWKSPKVSGRFREYSRFGETIGGDGFDQDCGPRPAVQFPYADKVSNESLPVEKGRALLPKLDFTFVDLPAPDNREEK